jgi:hypothetical protein
MKVRTAVRLAVMVSVMPRSRLVTVERDRNSVAEDRKERADRQRDRDGRPNVNPNWYAKSGGSSRRNGSPEARDDADG